jgi:hypothetical protein
MYRNLFKTGLCLSLAALSSQAFSQAPAARPGQLDTVIEGVHITAGRSVAGIPVNYDEALVGKYTLPDILTTKAGKKVTDKETWLKVRRPEILNLFETYQFGKVPPAPARLVYNVFDKGTPVFDGKGIRKQVRIYLTPTDTAKHYMDMLVYLPANSTKPAPLVLLINFSSNAGSVVGGDPGIRPGTTVNQQTGERTPAPSRGFGGANAKQILAEGFGVAMIDYTDIEPDFLTGYKYGIRGYYSKPLGSYPKNDEWGAISAWSWGLSRAMDYFEKDKQIDARRIAIQGVSRLAKTVLWTGARDTRFKMVIESCSGEGGGALSRRNFGENIKHMTDSTRYFYQFAANWHKYANDFNASPVDAHMLVALMAGRYLLMQTGNQDLWSDPHGEYLAAQAAEPVWKFFGQQGPGNAPWPKGNDESVAYNPLGYYMHVGGHGNTRTDRTTDWDVYLKYMKKFL